MTVLPSEDLDCVVVGAGWHGLAAAKQFHSLNPGKTIAVLDGQTSLGGKWAESRIFHGLKSNNLLGTYEYPDFPMSSDRFKVKPGEHIPAEVIHSYLLAYAKHFGIEPFIRLRTKVLTAEHDLPSGWTLTVESADPRQESPIIVARRLIIATGLLSEPFMPHFKGQDTFGGKLFHSKDFPHQGDTLKAEAVTVYGAGKSGWDAVYEYARAGVKVHWVIRASGHGPCWMAPPYVTPFKKWIEKLANIRFLTWFSPCIWGNADGYGGIRKAFHGTRLGRVLVDAFWNVLGNDVITLNKYDAHPDTAKLKPWVDAMFAGCTYSILNYEQDIFELVRSSMVDVHIDEIERLSPGRVHLASGTELACDVFFANTGYTHTPPMKFLPEGIEKQLGIPHPAKENDDPEDLANRPGLVQRADEAILAQFPRLRRQPVWNKNFVSIDTHSSSTPYMLYRFLVPPSRRFLRSRDIAFIGIQTNFSNAMTAHITGLWICAFFAGKLSRDPGKMAEDEAGLQQVQWEALLHNRFGKWRYPSEWGNKGPNFIFDAVPYLDLIQRDLGLSPFRKGGFFAEITSPYGTEDYRNINEEWLAKQGEDRKTR